MSDFHRSAVEEPDAPTSLPSTFHPPIEAVVAHPDGAVRQAMVAELAAAGVTVVGETGDGSDAVALVRRFVPDVALLATELPGTDGVGACRDLRVDLPVVRVLLIADHDDEDAIGGLRAGAYGCWLRTAPQTTLADAVRGTMRRESLPTAGWATEILESYATLVDEAATRFVPAPTLTPMEHDVLARLAVGETPAQVATAFEITSHMVRLHVGYAIVKLYRAIADERQLQALRG